MTGWFTRRRGDAEIGFRAAGTLGTIDAERKSYDSFTAAAPQGNLLRVSASPREKS